jgi:general secretion pathway protein G
MRSDKRRLERAGFTLVEILLVVAILGILAAIVVIKTTGQAEKARRQATWTQIAALKTAVAQFEMEVGRLPKDLQELVVKGDEKWPGPFLDSEEVPKDAWGNSFQYEFKDKLIRITSPGPDGQLGTPDDLWK